jgi:hypothetical protein
VGRRDERLLTLRAWTFGDRLAGAVSCPECGALLEIDATVTALRVPSPPEPTEALTLEHDGYRVHFRLPTAADLVELLTREDPEPMELLGRCLLECSQDGAPIPPEGLPDAVVTALAERMEAADPQASVHLAVSCPACAHRWRSPFDIVSFFWSEIDRWARGTLRDVHTLASTYGWPEGEILAMSAWRRQGYLSLIRG